MKKELTIRQNEIIQNAIELICEGGIQAVTIKNLAAKTKVTESALYRHFKSRTEIMMTLLDHIKSIVTEHYKSVSNAKGPAMERVKNMIMGQMRFFSEKPCYATVVLSDALYRNEKLLYDKILSIMRDAREAFMKIIEDGRKNGEIRSDISGEQLAFVIMGSMRLTINQWSLSDFSFDLKKKGQQLCKTIETLIQNK